MELCSGEEDCERNLAVIATRFATFPHALIDVDYLYISGLTIHTVYKKERERKTLKYRLSR